MESGNSNRVAKARPFFNADGDPEAAQLDKLVPDNVARSEDSPEKTFDFLKPYQMLAKSCNKTHLAGIWDFSLQQQVASDVTVDYEC